MLTMKLALPDTHNFPTPLSKRMRHDFVARNIVAELGQPKFESGFRCIRKFAALMSMPKAPVHEYGEPLLREHEIRLAEHFRASGLHMLPCFNNRLFL
jgi:hypothetical protein